MSSTTHITYDELAFNRPNVLKTIVNKIVFKPTINKNKLFVRYKIPFFKNENHAEIGLMN